MLKEKYLCEDKKYRYIYKITVTDTHQYYIGKHSTYDIDDGYMGSGTKILEYYELSGYNNIEKEILGYAASEEDLLNFEKEEIGDKWKTDPLCLNCVPGGTFNWTWKTDKRFKTIEDYKNFCRETSKKWRSKLSEQEMEEYKKRQTAGIKRHLEKFGAWWTGRTHSEETKIKQSKIAKGINRYGNKNPMFGMMWITNPDTKENKLIKKNTTIPVGFISGKYQEPPTPEQINKRKITVTGYKWITNGSIQMQLKKGCKLPDGFYYGHLKIAETEDRKERRQERMKRLYKKNYEKYKPMYDVYITKGFQCVVEKFNYTRTRECLVQQFKKYIKEFVPQPGKKRHN